jgi:transcriptional regulator with XRE-family HTH domain
MSNRIPDRLSIRLRELRGTMRQIDAAAESGISQPTITRFENGRQVPRADQVIALLTTYRASEQDLRELVEIANDLRARQRRIVLSRDHTAVQEEIKRIQETSSLIRSFSPSGISGLLQTPDYVRSIFGDDPGGRVRIEGQEILHEPHRTFVFLIPEGSLGWAMLPPAGMAEQMDHLAVTSERPNVRIGIVPWGHLSEVLPVNSWETYDDRAVWTGTNTGSSVLTAQTDIELYRALFGGLEQLAVFDDEARAILARVAERYRHL